MTVKRSSRKPQCRAAAREVVAEVLARMPGATDQDKRRALARHYPFGRRRHWQFMIWLDEINRQLRRGRHAPPYKQLSLFPFERE